MNRYELDADYIATMDSGNIIPLAGERTVYIDLCAAELSQHVLDIVTAEANRQSGCVNIILRRVGTTYGGVPRLIADRGEIYDALTKLLKEPEPKSAMFCDHANEVPARCPCYADCYCKQHTCKRRV